MSSPQAHSQFTVASGGLSYGALHNIWHGVSQPIHGFPTNIEQSVGGTVRAQYVSYNVAARNGIWKSYRLMDRHLGHTGFFVCHSEVSAEAEIHRILQVSGSPDDDERVGLFNDADTEAAGIMVINRYDWGFYNEQARNYVPGDQAGSAISNAEAGLVDFSHAKEYVRNWEDIPSPQRQSSAHGIWMNIPGEYMYGRFGFDNGVAQSFLFFCANTRFHQTMFEGLNITLQFEGTTEERFLHKLESGYDFSGVERLRKLNTPYNGLFSRQRKCELPLPEDRLSFQRSEYILTKEDFDAILDDMRLVCTEARDPGMYTLMYWNGQGEQPIGAESAIC